MVINPVQLYLDEVKSIVGATICLADERGKVLASIDKNMIGNSLPINLAISIACDEQVSVEQYLIKRINIGGDVYFLVSTSADATLKKAFDLLAYNIVFMLESSNSSNIVPLAFQQFVNGQILEEQFVSRLEQVRYNYECQHAILLVDLFSDGFSFEEFLSAMGEMFDFIDVLVAFKMKDNQIAVIYQESSEISADEMGNMLLSLLENDIGVNARVIVGPYVQRATAILQSYLGALAILGICSAFDNPVRFLNYDSVIWTRLINSIPIDVAKDFVAKVFVHDFEEELETEYRDTIIAFFENDLNISETARKLFIHRNTLVYRLDKINKMIGLDISKFEQAVKLYFTIMLKQYINIYESKKNIRTEE